MNRDREIPLDHDITHLVLTLDNPLPVGRGELCCTMRPHENGGHVVLEVLRRVQAHNIASPLRATHPELPAVTVTMRFPATPHGERKVEEVRLALDGDYLLENRPLRHFKSFHHATHALRGIRPETVDHLAGEQFPSRARPKQVTELLLATSVDDLYAYEQTHLHDHSRVRLLQGKELHVGEREQGYLNEVIQYVINVGAEYNRKLGQPPPVVHVIAACSSSPIGEALEKETNAAAAHFGKAITVSVERPIYGANWAEYVARSERDWIRHQRQLAREDGLPLADRSRGPALLFWPVQRN